MPRLAALLTFAWQRNWGKVRVAAHVGICGSGVNLGQKQESEQRQWDPAHRFAMRDTVLARR